jgi:hypothetical protein
MQFIAILRHTTFFGTIFADYTYRHTEMRQLPLFKKLPINDKHKSITIENKTQNMRYRVEVFVFHCPVHLFVISSSAKCLRVSKTESYGISRICFEMTRQATMPSSSEKCLHVSKTESYTLSRICFEMTHQATMPLSKA